MHAVASEDACQRLTAGRLWRLNPIRANEDTKKPLDPAVWPRSII
jgi:hypothetical protein